MRKRLLPSLFVATTLAASSVSLAGWTEIWYELANGQIVTTDYRHPNTSGSTQVVSGTSYVYLDGSVTENSWTTGQINSSPIWRAGFETLYEFQDDIHGAYYANISVPNGYRMQIDHVVITAIGENTWEYYDGVYGTFTRWLNSESYGGHNIFLVPNP